MYSDVKYNMAKIKINIKQQEWNIFLLAGLFQKKLFADVSNILQLKMVGWFQLQKYM